MIDVNEAFAWNLLFGIGETEFDAGTITLGTIAGTASAAADAVTNTDTATRFGVGLTYKMSESAALITMLQYTDYGTVDVHVTDGQTSVTSFDFEATQLSMRLRFMF
jgi:opacity protein-like surface antigen